MVIPESTNWLFHGQTFEMHVIIYEILGEIVSNDPYAPCTE